MYAYAGHQVRAKMSRKNSFRGSFDSNETGFEAGSSVIEAGKFPTDETDEKFQASSLDKQASLRTSPTINVGRYAGVLKWVSVKIGF